MMTDHMMKEDSSVITGPLFVLLCQDASRRVDTAPRGSVVSSQESETKNGIQITICDDQQYS